MSSEKQICNICKKPLKAEGTGVVTQFVGVCLCNLTAEEQDQIKTQKFCASCGKPIGSRRKGSMTQFIFSHGKCDCERPVAQSTLDEVQLDAGIKDKEETELKLDPNSFPLERYKPIKELGHGASGRVYLSRDRLLKNLVAVKTLLQISGEQLIAFQNEARSTSNLEDSRIVKVLDFGATTSGAPYMVLEFIDGSSLADVIATEGTIEISRALEIVRKVALALSYAHEHKVFHRDIKPSNILLVKDSDQVKVIDFGIAKIIDTGKFKQGDTIVGTPFYLSPDVGRGLEYSANSEVYSLACVLFEMLSGKPPFVGESALETISLHATASVPKIIGVSSSINQFIEICLAKLPEDRPPSMMDFAHRVNDLLEKENLLDDETMDQEVESSSAESQNTTSNQVNFKPIVLILCILVAVAVITVSGILMTQRSGKKTTNSAKPTQLIEQDHSSANVIINAATNTTRTESFVKVKGGEITCNHVNDAQLIKAVSENPQVRRWQIDHSQVSNLAISNLKTIPLSNLRLLNCNSIDNNVFKKLAESPTLKRIGIYRCDKLTSAVLTPLSRGQIRNLSIGTVSNSSKWIKAISKLKKLVTLSLLNMTIEESSLTPLTSLPKLKGLRLKNIKIESAKCLEPIAKLKSLEELILQEIQLDEESLKILYQIKNLKLLTVTSTGLTTQQTEKLKKVLQCKVVNTSQKVNAKDYVEMLYSEFR